MNDIKIDFVITWVDGNDKKWLDKKKKYLQSSDNVDVSVSRYRDWDFLKYWFRSVEKYASWVNKIYFVTDSQIPCWLNINNDKIVVVEHKDILPKRCLPTFNSNAIEMGIENIKNLSEYFVYFNDDMFINDFVNKEDFFINNLPCDASLLSPIIPREDSGFYKALANTVFVLNKNFDMKSIIKNNKKNWFSMKYGIDVLRNVIFSKSSGFCGFYNSHIPNSYLKSAYKKAIHLDEKMYNNNISSRFRNNDTNMIHWIAQYYQFATGQYYPRNKKIGKYYSIENNIDKLKKDILLSKHKLICINDNCDDSSFDIIKQNLIDIFNEKYAKKSSFERM